MDLLIRYPVLAFVVGGLLFAAYVSRKAHGPAPISLITAAVLWVLYGLLELLIQYASQGMANIRIDLLVIYPTLGIVTVVGVFEWWRSRKKTHNDRST